MTVETAGEGPRRVLFQDWRPATAALTALALVGGLLAARAAFETSGAGATPLLPLADSHLARAHAALDRERWSEAETHARKAASLSPARAESWLAVAYAVYMRDGLTPQALKALETSYVAGPFDPDASLWRLRFAFDNWTGLTPELRRDVLAEVDALWARPFMPRRLEVLSEELGDPSGRIALVAEITALNLTVPRTEPSR
ncbi:MAG TPA: hypothetical protein VD929_00915 [Caulobacteraceae bacterium]|nr:hypothetical protein [Caulobacteraceae bacterium]